MKKMNKLYVVAGKRNMGAHARLNGGLFANVGMTTRTVDERLSDQDYRNKAAGGVWEVIVRDHEIGSHDDTEIHDELKKRDDVVWSLDGLNTEEFLFVNDPGDGSVARDIVLQIAKNLSPRDKCIEPNASTVLEQRLLGAGVTHAGEVRKSNDSVCWLKVKSVIERNGPYGKYVIVKFDSESRDKAIFVWNSTAREFPVGNYFIFSGVRVSKKGNLECKGRWTQIRQEAAPARPPAEKEGEGAKTENSVWFKPDEGVTDIRIVPTKDGDPLKEMFFHYNVGDHKGGVLCPKRNFGDDCPICEFAFKLWREGVDNCDEESKKLAKHLHVRTRYFSPVVVRGREDEGIKVYGYDKQTYELLLGYIFDPEYGDITDTKAGTDITLTYTKPNKPGAYPQTSLRMRRNTSTLLSDAEAIPALLDRMPDFDGLFERLSIQQVGAILDEQLSGDKSAEGRSPETAKYGLGEQQEASDIDSVSPACEDVRSTNLAALPSRGARLRMECEEKITTLMLYLVPLIPLAWISFLYYLSS